MKTLLPAKITSFLTPDPSTVTPQEQRVLEACREAGRHERDYVIKACIAGALLLEYRATLLNSSNPSYPLGNPGHGGPGSSNTSLRHHKATPIADNFTFWVESHDIAITTAKRWMSAAERASRFALDLGTGAPFTNTIEVEGIEIPLSQALTLPDAELDAPGLKYKQAWFGFLADKTLYEATRGVVDGDSPASRMTRAAGGKYKGGNSDLDANPEARKRFPLFCGRALGEVLAHIGARVTTSGRRRSTQGGHWVNLTEIQKQEVREYFSLFLSGLDTELLEYHAETARAEVAARRKGKHPEPFALKSLLMQRQDPRRNQKPE